MNTIVRDALGRRPSRRQALVASSLMLLASAGLGTAASAAVGDQNSWRFCSKCASMFWDGGGNKGTCPAGGAHISQGLFFTPHYDDSAPANDSVQYNWRFCSKCYAMFYDDFASAGRCPSGGAHAPQGFNFGLNHAASAPPSSQPDWRFCQQCFALFWNGAPTKGRCPAGGGHVAQGFVFNLPFGAAVAAAPVALPQVLAYDTNSITFDNGVAADGNSHVKLHQDGLAEFQSHFHDSGAVDYWYSITWAIYASDGTVFRLHHRDKITGHLIGRGQSDRNSDFNQSTTNAAIAQHWAALSSANFARMSAHTAASIGGLIDTAKEVLGDVIQVAQSLGHGYQTVTTIVDIFV